jgi:hypothetical protein
MNEGTKNALHEAEAVSDSFANVSCHPDPYDGSRPATPDSFQQNFGYGEPEYDFDRDSDMSDSASLSPSYHSAGQGSARHYRAQMQRNEIKPEPFINDRAFSLYKFPFKPSDLSQQVNQHHNPLSKYSCTDKEANALSRLSKRPPRKLLQSQMCR